MKKKAHAAKKTKGEPVAENLENVPQSFVFCQGKVGKSLNALMHDLRAVMCPYTAKKLEVSRANKMKDFLAVAGPLGVTHFMIISATELSTYLRIMRVPRGPTIAFRIEEFSLIDDVKKIQKKPFRPRHEYEHSPLVVLNNFGSQETHMKLVTVTIQNMFPTLNVATVNLGDCRRVVLFNYDKETDKIELRHYLIRRRASGLSRPVKKILSGRIPDLHKLEDIAEFIESNGAGAVSSDSEIGTDVEARTVEIIKEEKKKKKKTTTTERVALQLVEIGPRLVLSLFKIMEGCGEGEVLYHSLVKKTPEEIAILRKQKAERDEEKKRRIATQEANVKRKEEEKKERKEKQKEKMARRLERAAAGAAEGDSDDSEEEEESEASDDDSEPSDAEWYRKEVGEEPEAGFNEKAKRGRARAQERDMPRPRNPAQKRQRSQSRDEAPKKKQKGVDKRHMKRARRH